MAKKQEVTTTTIDSPHVSAVATAAVTASTVTREQPKSFVRLDVTLFKMASAGKLAEIEFVFVKPPLEESMWGPLTVWSRKGKKAGVRVVGPGRIWTDDQQHDHFVPFVRSSNPNEDGLPPSVRELALAAYGHAVQVAETSNVDVVRYEPIVDESISTPYVRLDMTLLKAEDGPEGKLAEAEFVFVAPPLNGSMWGTFTVWQRKGKNGGVRVSGPGRTWTDDARKEHFVPLVRSTNLNVDGLPPSVLHQVLAAFEQATGAVLPAR
jgi:hypothetical protein